MVGVRSEGEGGEEEVEDMTHQQNPEGQSSFSSSDVVIVDALSEEAGESWDGEDKEIFVEKLTTEYM